MQVSHSLVQSDAQGHHIELNKTWIDKSFDGKQRYYRLDDSCLSFAERISQFAIVLFKTIATCGLALAFSFIRSQWREVIWNKREICILTEKSRPIHQISVGSGNLSDPQIEDLPSEHIEALTDQDENLSNRQSLELCDRQLQMVPESISSLSSLQKLQLQDNQIQTVPDSIGSLSNLQYLRFSHNQLQRISGSIGSLSHLQELWLHNNQLQAVPESIGNLSELRILSLGQNQLQAVPESIGNLSNLQKLELCHNQLQAVPESIGNLSNLQKLWLNRNQLQTVPDSIGGLSQLQELWLEYNQLQAVPECLFRLPRRCDVNLEGNLLTQEAIEQLRARVNVEGYQGPRFNLSVHERRRETERRREMERRRETDQPQDLSASLSGWCDDDCKQVLLERLSLQQQNSLDLWLSRLKDTADYRAQEQAVKDKVKHLLTWLAEETNEDHLQPAHQILAEATGTCGDRVALSLNTLSLHVRLCKSQELGLEELKDLIIGLDRYERLEKIAEQKCGQLRAVDPIEVHLCYQIHLKDALGLPIETNHMLYERLSGVSEADIEGAQQQILAETGPGQQMAILLEHPIWKKALENSPDFEKTKEACQQQKDEAQSQVDTTDYEAAAAFYQEFQEKDKTVWNPYYLLTQQIIEPKKLSHLLD